MSSKPAATYLSKSQQVAQKLLARIADADLDAGITFATEAELLQQFNVSRPTLREGIRILESQGILEQRPGPGGGIVIQPEAPEAGPGVQGLPENRDVLAMA